MSDDNRHPEEESDYPEVKLPDFKSDIPAPLLASAPEETRYVLEQLSVLSQYVKWSAPVLVEVSLQTRKTNGRLARVEAWKAMFTSWWGLLLGLFAIVGAAAAAVEVVTYLKGGG